MINTEHKTIKCFSVTTSTYLSQLLFLICLTTQRTRTRSDRFRFLAQHLSTESGSSKALVALGTIELIKVVVTAIQAQIQKNGCELPTSR
jgi:hypothetical protein